MKAIIKLGDKGDAVKQIQKALGIKADGDFGPNTLKMVKLFQASHGLMPDGVVGPVTQKLLFKEVEGFEEKLDTEVTEMLFDTVLLDSDEFISGPNKPEWLFLHHTAGWNNPYNTIANWNNDSRGRIATEFVVGGNSITGDSMYNGKVVKCLPDGAWAYHLGDVKSSEMIRNSVGIELCNFGGLTPVGLGFKTYTGQLVNESEICDLGYEWKGYRYWHKYSEAQIQATHELIKFIAQRDGIDICAGLVEWVEKDPMTAFDYRLNASQGKVKGMLSHSNVRKDKLDVAPQPLLIKMLKSL